MSTRTYSLKKNGQDFLATHFKVAEFACNDGSDLILLDKRLPQILQRIRNHFGRPVRINSGYRTPAWNALVGGEKNSFHLRGMAADHKVDGVTPRALYNAINRGEVLGVDPDKIGLGLYKTFVHVDVRGYRGRWAGTGVRL